MVINVEYNGVDAFVAEADEFFASLVQGYALAVSGNGAEEAQGDKYFGHITG